MLIFVKTLNGTTVTIVCESSDTIGEIYDKLAETVEIPPYNAQLIIAGRRLEIGCCHPWQDQLLWFLHRFPPLYTHALAFIDNGFETLQLLQLITESDCQRLRIPLGHRRLLFSKLSKLPDLTTDAWRLRQPQHLPPDADPDPDLVFILRDLRMVPRLSPDDQRKVVTAPHLHRGPTLADYRIQMESTLHMMLALRGDIGHFGLHEGQPGTELLARADAAASYAAEARWQVVEQVWKLSGRCPPAPAPGLPPAAANEADSSAAAAPLPRCFPAMRLLSPAQCKTLRHLLDSAASPLSSTSLHLLPPVLPSPSPPTIPASPSHTLPSPSAPPPAQDFQDQKLDLALGQLEVLVGQEAVRQLVAAFGRRVDEVKLRRVCAGAGLGGGGAGRCISFHLDHALRTLQVPLNEESEYEGARLVYLLQDRALIPSRAPGSATLHDHNVVHGVTRMYAGVRYSLFLLQHHRRGDAGEWRSQGLAVAA